MLKRCHYFVLMLGQFFVVALAQEPLELLVNKPSLIVFSESSIDYQVLVKTNGELIATLDSPESWNGQDYFCFEPELSVMLQFEFLPVRNRPATTGSGTTGVDMTVTEAPVDIDTCRLISRLNEGYEPTFEQLPVVAETVLQQRLAIQTALMKMKNGELDAAIRILTSIPNYEESAQISRILALIHRNTGDMKQSDLIGKRAVEQYRLVYSQNADFSLNLAQALAELADANLFLGNFDYAEQLLNEASQLSGESHYLSWLIYNNLSGVHDLQNQFDQALEYKHLAVTQAKLAGDFKKAAQSMTLIGYTHSEEGRYDLARESFYEALALLDSDDTALNERGYLLSNLGALHIRLGNLHKALLLLQDAGDIAAQIQDKQFQAQVDNQLGWVAEVQEDYEAALLYRSRWLAYVESVGSKSSARRIRARLGVSKAMIGVGDLDGAEAMITEAIELAQQINSEKSNADVQLRHAQLLLAQGNTREAISQSALAEQYYEAAQYLVSGIDTREVRSRAHMKAGSLDAAITVAEDAIEQIDRVRNQYQEVGVGQEFTSTVQNLFYHLTSLYVQKFKQEGKNRWLEKAFSVADVSRQYYLDTTHQTLSAEDEIKIVRLHNQIITAARKGDTAKANRLSLELDVLRTGEIKARSTTSLELANYNFNAAQARLIDGEIYLQFLIGKELSYLFAVTSQQIQYFELPGQRTLTEAVESVLPLLANPGAVPFQELIDLSERILPERLSLESYRHIIVSSDKAIRYIPFSVLDERGSAGYQPLVLNKSITYAKSLDRYDRFEDELQTAAVISPEILFTEAGVAPDAVPAARTAIDPEPDNNYQAWREELGPLPWAAQEAKDMTALFGAVNTTLLMGAKANLNDLMAGAIADADVVHYATHGFVSDYDLEYSGLMLSDQQGGIQFANWRDFQRVPSKAQLVVINGCETAIGRELNGSGTLGLTNAMIQSGASQVMTTLWKISDRASRELMLKFYREVREGKTTAEALRIAQTEMMNGRYRHPFYWAGYVINTKS